MWILEPNRAQTSWEPRRRITCQPASMSALRTSLYFFGMAGDHRRGLGCDFRAKRERVSRRLLARPARPGIDLGAPGTISSVNGTGYKLLGLVVWRGGKWYLRKRVPSRRKLVLGGVTAAAGAAVLARRLAS
jgi:hypothetical protein